MTTNARNVQLFLIDGDANGLIRAQLDNWTGVAYKIPAIRLQDCKNREELSFCGVYFLFGHDDEKDADVVYVGQSRERKNGLSIIARGGEHKKDKSKDFLSEIVFFTNSTDDFGPTELCYLENHFYKLAVKAGRYVVKNGNEPSAGNVTEAKQADLDRYIDNAKILMTALGYNVFRNMKPEAADAATQKSIRFWFKRHLKAQDLDMQAEGLWTDKDFIVCAGSDINPVDRAGLLPTMKIRRDQAFASADTEKKPDGLYTLKKDLCFASPSSAGQFVLGGSVDGRTAWVTESGQKFEDVDQLEKEDA